MNDLPNGKGQYWHADGDYYEGFWKDGLAHGQGIYRASNGSCYDGEWKEDL